jgi:hypothetical protein
MVEYQFRKLFLNESPVDRRLCDEQRRYFLYDDSKSFGQRLLELVNSLERRAQSAPPQFGL